MRFVHWFTTALFISITLQGGRAIHTHQQQQHQTLDVQQQQRQQVFSTSEGLFDIMKWDKEDNFKRKEEKDEKNARQAVAANINKLLNTPESKEFIPFMEVDPENEKAFSALYDAYMQQWKFDKSTPEYANSREAFKQNLQMIQQWNVRSYHWSSLKADQTPVDPAYHKHNSKDEAYYLALNEYAILSETKLYETLSYKPQSIAEMAAQGTKDGWNVKGFDASSKEIPLTELASSKDKSNIQVMFSASAQAKAIPSKLLEETAQVSHTFKHNMLRRIKHTRQSKALDTQQQEQQQLLEQALHHEQTHGVGVPPAGWDWRGVGVLPEVKAQRFSNFCWGYAGVACVQAITAIQRYAGCYAPAGGGWELDNPVQVSIVNTLSCSYATTGDAVGSGGHATSVYSLMGSRGLCQKNALPDPQPDWDTNYRKPVPVCNTQCHNTDAASGGTGAVHKPVRIDVFFGGNVVDEGTLVWDVYRQPISVSIKACWQLFFARRGFFSTEVWTRACRMRDTNHAVVLVGYGNAPAIGNFWIMRNSWGASWGVGGHLRVARGVNLLDLTRQPSYPYVRNPSPLITRPAAQYRFRAPTTVDNFPIDTVAHFPAGSPNVLNGRAAVLTPPHLNADTWFERRDDGVTYNVPLYRTQYQADCQTPLP